MITARDKLILRHIEQYGFITNRQAREIFMDRNSVKAYEIARRRLKVIIDSGITFTNKNRPLKVQQNKITGEYVFYYTSNPPSYHDIQIMNFYAGLVFIGVEVELYKKHAEWLGGKYVSDAFLVYSVDGVKNIACLEMRHTHNGNHIQGYEELHRTNELQKKFNGAFPRIILVGYNDNVPDTFLKVTNVKEDLSDIFSILK